MASTEARQAHPFDGVAPTYDAAFTEQRLGRWLRAAVWAELDRAFQPGDHVLDLGCGTGEDALHLAGRGVRVTALDASAGMLAVAEAKLLRAGCHQLVTLTQADLAQIGQPGARLPFAAPPGGFDGAYADFGPLNCVADLHILARGLAALTHPHARLVAVVMGPLCPWEVAWYLAHGHPRTATRRFRRRVSAVVGDRTIEVSYPSPRRLRADLAPWFQQRRTVGVGTLLPPSHLGGLVERAPGLFARLHAREAATREHFPWTWLNDHYLSTFERNA